MDINSIGNNVTVYIIIFTSILDVFVKMDEILTNSCQ